MEDYFSCHFHFSIYLHLVPFPYYCLKPLLQYFMINYLLGICDRTL